MRPEVFNVLENDENHLLQSTRYWGQWELLIQAAMIESKFSILLVYMIVCRSVA